MFPRGQVFCTSLVLSHSRWRFAPIKILTRTGPFLAEDPLNEVVHDHKKLVVPQYRFVRGFLSSFTRASSFSSTSDLPGSLSINCRPERGWPSRLGGSALREFGDSPHGGHLAGQRRWNLSGR